MKTKDLPRALQPSCKLDRLGSENLSEVDLLALIIRSGNRSKNELELAEEALVAYGSLTAISRATVKELQSNGLSEAKAKSLKASLELARHLSAESLPENPLVTDPEEAYLVMKELVRPLDREKFWVILLNTKNRLIVPPCEVSVGTLNSSLVHPREIFKPAVRHSAASMLLVHNHPSGDPSPSSQDIKITKKLIEAGKLMGIDVLDHVIIGGKNPQRDPFLSLRESGLVEF